MKIIVIGAVAAGMSAAAKARRNDDFAIITVYDRDSHISYSGCGLPYFIGGEVKDIEELTPRDPEFFKKKYNIDVLIRHEVLSVNREEKIIEVMDLNSSKVIKDSYDKLVIASGAVPFIPDIEGVRNENVFTLRNVNDALNIKKYIDANGVTDAVIAGTGFIGLELAENFVNIGLKVSMIEIKDRITANFDKDMADYLEDLLVEKDIGIYKGKSVSKIKDDGVVLNDGMFLSAGIVIIAAGVRPNTEIFEKAGIIKGITGGILVDEYLKTSDPDIYACGDCIETFDIITGRPCYRPLGTTANKTGRIAGDAVTGGSLRYEGNLGTGIFKVFEIAAAVTGLTEEAALREGYDIEISHNIKPDKPKYYHGEEMVIKAVADRKTGRLLGAQIIGYQGVDKRIDVFSVLITFKATVDMLFHLDLAYAPPFSTTKDPVHYTGMILDNAINRGRKLILRDRVFNSEKVQVIDARSKKDYDTKGHVEGALSIPHEFLRDSLEDLDPEVKTVTYCNKGVTGNAAQNILINRGFKEVYNLSGGHKFYKSGK